MRLILLIALLISVAQTRAAEQSAAALFEQHCAICHDRPETRAPSRATLQQMPLSRILSAMEIGRMAVQASALTAQQREAVADYLAASAGTGAEWIAEHACASGNELAASANGREFV